MCAILIYLKKNEKTWGVECLCFVFIFAISFKVCMVVRGICVVFMRFCEMMMF